MNTLMAWIWIVAGFLYLAGGDVSAMVGAFAISSIHFCTNDILRAIKEQS